MQNILIIVLVLIIIITIYNNIKNKNNKITSTGNINEESYQKYAKFYENTIPKDSEFNKKINLIYQAIIVEKQKDIKKLQKKQDVHMMNVFLK